MSTENVTAAENEIRSALELANDEEATSITHAMVANTLATLALVEQQRIANLIATFEMESGPHKVANNWVADECGDGEEDANVRILREIREALGLA